MSDFICAELADLARLRSSPRDLVRRHIHAPGTHLYVRIGPRVTDYGTLQALVLADITVQKDQRQQGVFSTLLARLEREAPALGLQVVVVENVLNLRLWGFLARQGYTDIGLYHDTLYKVVP